MKARPEARGAKGRLAPPRFWHPAFDYAAAERSPMNLRGEAEVARFAIGAFSLLAFLELEGAARRPSSSECLLGPDGLPRWNPEGMAEAATDVHRDHARLVHRLLGGRGAPEGRPWPSVPRRHRSFAHWNRWFAAAQECTDPSSSCHHLLLGLWELWDRCAFENPLPASWGFGSCWEQAASWAPGLQSLAARGTAAMGVALGLARRPPQGLPPLRPVFLGAPPPYPYASLEPLVGQALGCEEEGRRWLGERLAAGGETLQRSLAEMLARSGESGWLVWPSETLDGHARKALEAACVGLAVPVVLVGDDPGAPPAASVARVRCLWLPATAEAWYLRHAGALLGPQERDLVLRADGIGPGRPRCGQELLPPIATDASRPASPWLGDAVREDGRPGRARRAASPDDALREGRLADLAFAVRDLEARRDGTAARFWKGRLLLELGQPQLALEAFAPLAGTGFENRACLHRARAHERLHDFEAARRTLAGLDAGLLDSDERAQASLLEGQLLWLGGDSDGAEGRFDGVLDAPPSADLAAQAMCHKATVALHANDQRAAIALLDAAARIAPRRARPLTKFILLHRRAMAHRKAGRFAEALDGFEAARAWAAGFALRDLEAWATCECGNVLRRLHRFEDAAHHLERAAQGAAALGLRDLEESALFDTAVCRVEAGELQEARRVLEAAIAREGGRENPVHRAVDHYWLAVVSAQTGDVPRALDLCERGLGALGDLGDAEVRAPLLVLRGELLLATGQLRKLGRVLEALDGLAGPDLEPDDLLAAAALRRAAAAEGVGRFTARELRQAVLLVREADPSPRAFWHLMSARAVEYGADLELMEAWRQAGQARSPNLACRALWALAGLRSLPPVDRETAAWLVTYLRKNGIRGPERGLLPLLEEEKREDGSSRTVLPSDEVAFLAAAERAPEASMEEALSHFTARCACLVVPGMPPRWWGECTADQRQTLRSMAGRLGRLGMPHGEALGVAGPEGLWCGLLRDAGRPFSEREAGVARIWARLLGPPAGAPMEGPPLQVHPLIAREILTRSPAMGPVLEALHRAAAFHFPVLLTGEPGVGKEACARALHGASPRGAREWVPFNCANLSPTLAASQLFGHRRGAFTGADRDQPGLVESARGSTLFLDEVGELPREVQPQLLRFLQDGDFLPLGESRPRRSDARIVSATNRDLMAGGADGRFRKDLYHRLNVIPIEIPPLRRRPEDIPLLFGHFLSLAAGQANVPEPRVEPSVLSRLAGYPWPGNVRELQNLAKALLVTSHGSKTIREAHLPKHLSEGSLPEEGGETLAAQLHRAEREAIAAALRDSGGSPSGAARALGVSRQSLHQKLRRLQMG